MITFSCKNIGISLTFGFFFILSVSSLSGGAASVSLLFCAVHELSHLAAMAIFGVFPEEIKFYGAGVCISSGGVSELSRPKRLTVYLSGPLSNLILAAALSGEASLINLSLALFNLLPVEYFDGGKLLALFLGEKSRALRAISFGFSALAAALVFAAAVYAGRAGLGSSAVSLGFILLSRILDG